jgi:hypothetical protein
MKQLMVFGAVILPLVSGEVMAACSDTQVTPLSSLIKVGTFVTATHTNGDSWHEVHQASGVLCDVKKGSGHAVDPAEVVGSWSLNSGDDQVTYNYGSGGTYTYTVHAETGGGYTFCGTTVITGATINQSSPACP